jgi:hypothetical protein
MFVLPAPPPPTPHLGEEKGAFFAAKTNFSCGRPQRASEREGNSLSAVRPSVGLVWLVNLGVGVDDKLATMRPPPAAAAGDFLLGALWLLSALAAALPPPAAHTTESAHTIEKDKKQQRGLVRINI